MIMREEVARPLGEPLDGAPAGPAIEDDLTAVIRPLESSKRASTSRADLSPGGEWLAWRRWAWIAGAWSLVGLLSTQQTYVALTVSGRGIGWGRLLIAHIPGALLWILLTPPIVEITRRQAESRQRWIAVIPIHLAGIFVATALDALLYDALGSRVLPYPPTSLVAGFVRYLNINITNYLGVVAVTLLARYATLLQERQLVAAELSSQLTVAHLRVLQSQLRPHFLFNTLNTVAELVHRDAAAADRMITRLGVLLRRSFDSHEAQEVPLRTELEFLQDYVDIMKLRFGGRIAITLHVEPSAQDALVPSLVLQPLVENAIRHGLEPRLGKGTVTVVARRQAEMLELEVRDDGQGLPVRRADGSQGWRMGVGLQNTADRLRHLYGDAHRFDIRSRPGAGGGTTVAIELPFHSTTALGG